MKKKLKKEEAICFYTFLLKLYPQQYRQIFGSQMIQTFKDYYTDVVEIDGKAAACFWFDIVSDEMIGIIREQLTDLKEGKNMKEIWQKQGILFGVILGVIHIGYNLINNLAPANITLNSLLTNSIIIIVLIFSALAGYSTARKTGQMKTGTYAGLFTGILSIVIGMSALFVITLVFTDIIRHNAFMIYDFHRSGLKSIDQFIIEDAIGATLVGTLFSLFAGGIFGTLGGYLGITLKEQH